MADITALIQQRSGQHYHVSSLNKSLHIRSTGLARATTRIELVNLVFNVCLLIFVSCSAIA